MRQTSSFRHAAAIAPLLLLGAVFVPPAGGPASAQQDGQRVTGQTEMQAPPPPPRGMTVEQDGRQLTLPVGPGGAVDIRGANVIVEEGPRHTRVVVNNDVLFEFDKATLRPEAREALSRVAEIIGDRRPREIRVVGHTDAIGSDAYNMDLSLRRARSVEQWLTAEARVPAPVEVEGKGESQPVAPNTTPDGRDNPEGRQQNRRVEIYLER